MRTLLLAVACATPFLGGCGRREGDGDPRTLRIGHFPNVTHAHGLVLHHRSRPGEGPLEKRLGPGMKVEWYVFNAGPSAMEAMRAGSLDATYVGPNPALNAHIRTGGREVRVLAGATRGGSALVVPGDGRIRGAADLRGGRVATPQLGNTQDVACRAWLTAAGLAVGLGAGGDVRVDGVANPDQLTLFKKGDLDAVWTVEPWVSRLEAEAGGKTLLEEPDAITTILVVSARLLAERPEVARSLLAAHQEMTVWLTEHPKEAQAEVRAALEAETKAAFSPDLLARAWGRLKFSDAITREEFDGLVTSARAVGFLENAISLDRIMGRP